MINLQRNSKNMKIKNLFSIIIIFSMLFSIGFAEEYIDSTLQGRLYRYDACPLSKYQIKLKQSLLIDYSAKIKPLKEKLAQINTSLKSTEKADKDSIKTLKKEQKETKKQIRILRNNCVREFEKTIPTYQLEHLH